MRGLSTAEESGAVWTERISFLNHSRRFLTWMAVFATLCLSAGPVVAAIVSADSTDTVVDSRDPVVITAQPVGATVNAGTLVNLSVTATGSSLNYQWRRNGVAVSGATGATYTINSVVEAHEGNYDVVVSNSLGSVTSSMVVLSVNDPVVITAQPVSQGVLQGAGVNFSVMATGTGPVSYQWRLNGTNISGATVATYSIDSVSGTHGGTYVCAVTNVVGTVVSTGAVLTVGATITVQPVDATVNPGNSASLSVTAAGFPLNYQWRKGGVNISGATGATYTINPVAESHEGSYDVVVSNSLGSVTSSTVVLSVNDPVVITSQPVGSTVNPGTVVSMRVTATGSSPLYQWRRNGVAVPGATSSTYTMNPVTESDEGSYDVVVSNLAGTVTSSAVVLNVNNPVVITAQPAARAFLQGGSASFSVTATGTGTLSYQWRQDGVNITGATSATYSIGSVTPVHSGTYTCAVTNVVGTVVSDGAVLTVAPVITSQPVGSTVNPGTPVTLGVGVTGSPSSYQWRRNGVAVPGATNSTYTMNPVTESHEGSYDVVVSNLAGTVTSSVAVLSVNDPVVITAQPLGATVNPGELATFSVTATGTGPFSYQWRKGSVAIVGATGATYTVSSAVEADEGEYSVLVTNIASSVVSAAAFLSVNDPVTITSQPSSVTLNPGGTASFSVAAVGSGALTYQWRKGGVVIPGATGSTYTIAAVTESDEGGYSVVVTSVDGSTTSVTAVLSVNDPAGITVQPVNRTVNPGASASFSVLATGTGPVTYRWRKGPTDIPGATGSSYTIAAAAEGDEGIYSVVVSNALGSVSSAGAVLSVNDPVVITAQPLSRGVLQGAGVSFAVAATGTGTLSYQWRLDGVNIAGSTSTTYSIGSVTPGHSGTYTCVVTNVVGSVVSNGAALTAAPAITSQPVGALVLPGSPVSFSVTATGTGPLSYQWRKGGVDIAGATGPTHAIASVADSDVGSYSVVVTNAAGSVVSAAAVLEVPEAARVGFGSSVYPGAKGPGELLVPVTVQRLADGAKAVEVRVAASSDTLQPGDYSLPDSPVLRWASGDLSEKTFVVVLRAGRTVAEAGETLRLTLQDPVGAQLGGTGTTTVALTARNPGVLQFGAASLERVKPDTGDLSVELVVRRLHGTSGAVRAEVAVSGGTALATDYVVDRPVVLEWADGDSGEKSVPVLFKAGAAVPVSGKTLQFRLQNLSGGALPGGILSSTVTVRPVALPGTVVFGSASVQAAKAVEGDTVVPITVQRILGGAGPVGVQVAVAGGTAVLGEDYTLPEEAVALGWGDGELGAKSFELRIPEGAQLGALGETVVLKLQAASGGVLIGRTSVVTVKLLGSDTSGPVLAVESPGSGVTVSGGSVLVKGTATDTSEVARVEVKLNDGPAEEAELASPAGGNTVGWMLALVPEQGSNTLKIRAWDARGNASTELVRVFKFSHVRPEFAGTYDGLLRPETTVAELVEGYPLSPGIAEAFGVSRGRGLLTATVSAGGAVSGKLSTGGVVAGFKGMVMRDGSVLFDGKQARFAVRKMVGRVATELGSLSLRVREGDPALLVGELSFADGTVELATVEAQKAVYSAARVLPAGMERVPVDILDPASENGKYTVLFEPLVDEGLETNRGLARTGYPQAAGYARMTVAPAGTVTLTGVLADGTTVSYSNRLAPDGTLPLYLHLYGNRGFVNGTVGFDDQQAASDVSAPELEWYRPAGLAAPYAAGWPEGITVELVGSKYVAPGVPTRTVPVPANPYGVFGPERPVNSVVTDTVPDLVPVELRISGGGLAGEIANVGRVNGLNVLSVTGPLVEGGALAAGIRWTVAARDGGFTGSFTHPVTNRAQTFAGVVLQKTQRAGGFFRFVPATGSSVPAGVGALYVEVP